MFGSLYYFGESLLLGARGIQTDPHSHYAISLLFSLKGEFQLVDARNETAKYRAVLIPPNFFHTLQAESSEMIVLQFDPKSYEYASLLQFKNTKQPTEIAIESISPLFGNCAHLLNGSLNCKEAFFLYESILLSLGGKPKQKNPNDKRMIRVLERIQETLPESISLKTLSDEIGISEDRFMHWFKDEFGLPLRQYLLWRRLHIAANHLQQGESLTTAAHAAGFSDQSHLSKTFRKMFGVPPSRFLGQPNQFKVCFCLDQL
ncbi:DNA-binding helix-turn-helix protein [Leptospira ryugenii]|uniref:DNA-binding helix-turn-helix protein n=1 Tax=Leptospira ryugenii TaxID=1917863 RepID=A0A2P2DXY0_9LEPT|nr:AraC family transcriptional regulator [Leptospira ryugenii]GBF49494.1 DNA-binding helix-turn-helix protein [Leptospira ryugenii]